MKDKSPWIAYANENLAVAKLSLDAKYFNACLQNAQQAVEKYLKATLLLRHRPFKKTHSIEALHRELLEIKFDSTLTLDDCDLLDSIYIPSKYPMGNALPDFVPNEEICKQVLHIAERVKNVCT